MRVRIEMLTVGASVLGGLTTRYRIDEMDRKVGCLAYCLVSTDTGVCCQYECY